jgi:ABC-type multidrug transport system ATPase subunit
MMVALYGDPLVRLLDECSTGLDPSSRVAMVDTIKSSRRGTTVFTTHSMSEAEKLCLKTVIMGKGKVLEFDFISKLKSKYFSCCWVTFRIAQGQDEEQAKEIIRGQLLREGIKETSSERALLTVEIEKQTVLLSEVLGIVQKLKAQSVI